jgi:hypothetical protein
MIENVLRRFPFLLSYEHKRLELFQDKFLKQATIILNLNALKALPPRTEGLGESQFRRMEKRIALCLHCVENSQDYAQKLNGIVSS